MSKCEYCEITFHIQFTQLKYYLLQLLLVQYIYIYLIICLSFIHLTISFDHDYLLVEVHSGTSYAEIRFQIVNLFRYFFKTDEQENDLRFVHQGGLASSDFPLVIMTVGIWERRRFTTRSKCKCELAWHVETAPRSSTSLRTFFLPPRLICIVRNV